jgi:hypothetical protein
MEEKPSNKVESVRRSPSGQLVVRLRGQADEVADAKVARCFPWSLTDRYIAIRDKEGKELALLSTLAELDETSRRVVEQELADKIFNPRIQKVTAYKHEFGVISITAVTDRGEITFQIRSRDDIRVLSPTRALLRDADGNTYEIADVTALDPASRKHLQDYF